MEKHLRTCQGHKEPFQDEERVWLKIVKKKKKGEGRERRVKKE
jgi:uncharacterized protein YifE (UPF0438 family)